MHNGLIRGLVDIGAFMLVMVATIVWELKIMHMVSRNESYKTTSSTIIKALGRIINILVKARNV